MPVVTGELVPQEAGTCLATKWLCVGGIEIANACRTLAYLKNVGHSRATLPAGLCCCGTDSYLTPAVDDAPWYDPSIPESAEVLGVWLEEMQIPSPYTRTMRARQWGGTLSAVRWGPREVHLVGWMYTKSGAATEYARGWLLEALSGLDSGACDLPDAVLYRANAKTDLDADRLERTARRVGLIDYKDDLEPEFDQCWGFKFEATLSAETPFLYGRPSTVFDGPVLDPASPVECNVCGTCGPPAVEPCQCGPMQAPVRVVTADPDDAGFCRPVRVRRQFVAVPPTPYWQTATAIVTVRCGALPATSPNPGPAKPKPPSRPGMRNFRIAAFQNPLGLLVTANGTDDFRDYFLCQDPCMTVEISCLPASARLIVDGTVRSAQVNCGGTVISGYPYLSSSGGSAFQWPEFGCNGLMLMLESDADNTPSDTSMQVQYVPRDRR